MANVNNYIAAGRSAVRKNLKARQALADNKTDYGALGEQGIKAIRDQKIAVIRSNALVATKVQNAMTQVRGAEITDDRDNFISNSMSQARKAGMLAGGAALLGVGAMQMNKNDEPDGMLAKYQELIGKNSGLLSEADQKIEEARAKLNRFTDNPTSKDTGTPSTKQTGNTTTTEEPTSSNYSLTGNKKFLADRIAGPESGLWGYDAFNQGGAAGGTQVLGKSGSHKKHFGKALTSMTIGEVLQRQSGYNDKSISDEQWRANGGLHAVGRYQFIGPTLKDEVTRMGLSMDTPFNQKTQDDIFFSHAKRVGNISPWIGPSNKYSAAERQELNNIIQGL